MRIDFLSIIDAEAVKPNDDIALISITEPGQKTNMHYDEWKHHIKVIFHDAVQNLSTVRLVQTAYDLTYFSTEQARDIINFVKALPDNVNHILVHCYGGN